MNTQTVRLNGCAMKVEYDWIELTECLHGITEITPIEGDTTLDILENGITLEMIQDHVAEHHINEEPFEER